jgi:hypothetical protein
LPPRSRARSDRALTAARRPARGAEAEGARG